MGDVLENMFSLDLPEKKVSPSLDSLTTEQTGRTGRKKLTASERLQRKKDREEAGTKAQQPEVKKEELKLDLESATKAIGGILVAMSRTKTDLTQGEIKAMSATAEQSLAQVIQVENAETNKWIIHSQTAIVWIGTLLPRFLPNLFQKQNGQPILEQQKVSE